MANLRLASCHKHSARCLSQQICPCLFVEVLDKSKFGYYSQSLAQERQDRTNDNDNEEQCEDKLLVLLDEEEGERSLWCLIFH
jgi:hypothetical protein